MHIAASLMTMMARPSCTTVRLFGASHCHVLPLRPACTVVVRSPRGGWGTVTWLPSPGGWWGTVFPGVGNDKGGGGTITGASSSTTCWAAPSFCFVRLLALAGLVLLTLSTLCTAYTALSSRRGPLCLHAPAPDRERSERASPLHAYTPLSSTNRGLAAGMQRVATSRLPS